MPLWRGDQFKKSSGTILLLPLTREYKNKNVVLWDFVTYTVLLRHRNIYFSMWNSFYMGQDTNSLQNLKEQTIKFTAEVSQLPVHLSVCCLHFSSTSHASFPCSRTGVVSSYFGKLCTWELNIMHEICFRVGKDSSSGFLCCDSV
jgi:hypothetical protein